MAEFEFDFSGIQWADVNKLHISMSEVFSLFRSETSQFFSLETVECIIGFTEKRKFVIAAFRVAENPNFDLEILQIDLPYEEDIKTRWCARQE